MDGRDGDISLTGWSTGIPLHFLQGNAIPTEHCCSPLEYPRFTGLVHPIYTQTLRKPSLQLSSKGAPQRRRASGSGQQPDGADAEGLRRAIHAAELQAVQVPYAHAATPAKPGPAAAGGALRARKLGQGHPALAEAAL